MQSSTFLSCGKPRVAQPGERLQVSKLPAGAPHGLVHFESGEVRRLQDQTVVSFCSSPASAHGLKEATFHASSRPGEQDRFLFQRARVINLDDIDDNALFDVLEVVPQEEE